MTNARAIWIFVFLAIGIVACARDTEPGDDTSAGSGANIGKARLAWSYRPSAQALPYYYGRAVIR